MLRTMAPTELFSGVSAQVLHTKHLLGSGRVRSESWLAGQHGLLSLSSRGRTVKVQHTYALRSRLIASLDLLRLITSAIEVYTLVWPSIGRDNSNLSGHVNRGRKNRDPAQINSFRCLFHLRSATPTVRKKIGRK